MAEKEKKVKKSKRTDEDRPSKKPKQTHKTKSSKERKLEKHSAPRTLSLLADEKNANSALLHLFAAKPTPPVRSTRRDVTSAASRNVDDLDLDLDDESDEEATVDPSDLHTAIPELSSAGSKSEGKRKRKRKDEEDDLEDQYMSRLAREEKKEVESLAAERAAKKGEDPEEVSANGDADGVAASEDKDGSEPADTSDVEIEDGDDDLASPPPKHETEMAADVEMAKANRTAFLGNVATTVIASKTARKTLLTHLQSFFDEMPSPKEGEPKHKIESIRFRSTPYASAGPKKAAFAKKELMDATTKSTNAYVVYSSQALTREAAKRLNGTVVLDRHLRVDEVAHPAKIDSRRCVFVGNLGFVDDESNIQQANSEDGQERRKPGRTPADIEEGLWRTFGKCGSVESVRVIRDSKTRVSKGVAYVQFHDENAVESALLYEGKKFPPMLPRTLRVTRARAPKRNAKPGSGRPSANTSSTGYQRKISGAEASQIGRAKKLYGRAGAAQVRQTSRKGGPVGAVKLPESFVFEGHRASEGRGQAGLKFQKGGGKKKKKAVKPTSRSARRGAAFKKAARDQA